MTVEVRVRNLAGLVVRQEKLEIGPETTAAQVLLHLGGIPGTVWLDGKALKPEDPVLPELTKSGCKKLEVRDP